MDTTLVTVTILSMGMAAALSVIVWRMLRDERRRSEARVAALSAAANAAPIKGAPLHRSAIPPKATLPPRAAISPERAIPPESGSDELPLNHAPVSAGAMFVPAAEATPWWNRLAVMGGFALVCTSVALFALAAAKSKTMRSAEPAAARVSASDPVAPGLELLSLRDARTADALTITGMVRNPSGAALRSRVAVTAYAFDEKGAFLASGRALLDVTSLAPGDESPFVVTIPVTESVARYRIGFRGEDGRVIAHVDKRQPGPMAALRPGPAQANW